jgi:hypothetical protein
MLIELTDEKIDRKCAQIRERLVALCNHKNQMSKDQINQACAELIESMIAIVELSQK